MVSQPARELRGNITAFPGRARVRETAKAAAAYAAYEQMPEPRSYERLAKLIGKESGYSRQIERWAGLFHWQDRLLKYEETQLEVRRKRREDAINKMDEEQALIGRTQLFRAVEFIKNRMDTTATMADAIRLMRVSYELERLARGAATSKVEADVKVGILPKEYVNIGPDEEGCEN